MKYVAILCLVLPLFSLTQAQEFAPVLEYRFQQDAKDASARNLYGTVHGNPRFEVVDDRVGIVFDGEGDWGEADEGIHCVAAPIRDRLNVLVAMLWVSGIAGRMPKSTFASVAGEVMKAAGEIERRLRA